MKKPARTNIMHTADYWLVALVIALLCIGLVMIFSASSSLSYTQTGRLTYYFERQLIWLLIGATALYTLSRIDYHFWQQWPVAVAVIGVTIFVLLGFLLLTRGRQPNSTTGAIRWLVASDKGLSIQPSEIAKVTIIMYIAAWLASKRQIGLVPFGLLLGILDGLVASQPSLSTAVLIAATAVIMFWVAGANVRDLAILLLVGLIGGAISMNLNDYQSGRFSVFFNDPFADRYGSGFQPYHTALSLISGRLTGVGLGVSRQKDFFGLVPHTDVILAITGEEIGFIGVLLVMVLFIILAYRGLRIALKASDTFGSLLAIGITSWLGVQAIIHAGVVTLSMPFTGVPLPFISYGGSALLAEMAGIGILLSISKSATKESILDNANLVFGRRNGWTRLPDPYHN